jgi:hypothetical protein
MVTYVFTFSAKEVFRAVCAVLRVLTMGAFSEWAVAHAWNGYVAVRSFPAILAIAERISVNVAFANSVVAVRVVTLRRSRCVLRKVII